MKVGFTGTHLEMTSLQLQAFEELIEQWNITEFHHGDCVGADYEAHESVFGLSTCAIVIHPPLNNKARAFCAGSAEHDVSVLPARPYLDRNKDIVNQTDRLIACPNGIKEEVRSGTWSTVRFARKRGKPVTIIFPDGNVEQG